MRRSDRPLLMRGPRLALPGGPKFSNVVLLQNCTEANGATTFIDSSSFARTITTVGGAVMSTTSPPAGANGSITMDGTLDAYKVANSTDFDLTDTFTVEAFLKPVNPTPGGVMIIGGLRAVSGNENGVYFYIASNNTTLLVVANNGTSNNGSGAGADFSSSTFRHFMVSGDGSFYYVGVDGVIKTRFSRTLSPGASSGEWMWGSWTGEGAGTRNWNGQIGPTRVTKGECLYAGNTGDAYMIPGLPFATS